MKKESSHIKLKRFFEPFVFIENCFKRHFPAVAGNYRERNPRLFCELVHSRNFGNAT